MRAGLRPGQSSYPDRGGPRPDALAGLDVGEVRAPDRLPDGPIAHRKVTGRVGRGTEPAGSVGPGARSAFGEEAREFLDPRCPFAGQSYRGPSRRPCPDRFGNRGSWAPVTPAAPRGAPSARQRASGPPRGGVRSFPLSPVLFWCIRSAVELAWESLRRGGSA